MLSIKFKNAEVYDRGFGLVVNGKDLDEIISIALGTKVGDKQGYGSGLPEFKSNSCDISITITPHPTVEIIGNDNDVYTSVKQMEEDKQNEYNAKNEKTDPEE